MLFTHNGKQLAPCVVSKAKVALGIQCKYTGNRKRFSFEYWQKTVHAVGYHYGKDMNTILDATEKYDHYLNAI